MKLPNFLQHQGFNRLRQLMHAPLVSWNQKVIPIVCPPVPDRQGTLIIDGQRVAVYIRDQYRSAESASEPEELNRVHVAECDTLKQMRDKGKYDERYVATIRTDGLFNVNLLGRLGSGDKAEGADCRLYPCIKCLRRLNYKGYDDSADEERWEIREYFNMAEFYDEYGGSRVDDLPPRTVN